MTNKGLLFETVKMEGYVMAEKHDKKEYDDWEFMAITANYWSRDVRAVDAVLGLYKFDTVSDVVIYKVPKGTRLSEGRAFVHTPPKDFPEVAPVQITEKINLDFDMDDISKFYGWTSKGMNFSYQLNDMIGHIIGLIDETPYKKGNKN
tara:strand:+ start:259 stop:702 length:444 start_codon:yes stop_codon:yes gene_type:complete